MSMDRHGRPVRRPVTTPSRGQALGLNGTSSAVLAEAGYPIPLGWQGLSLEPQVQPVYQHLGFGHRTDVDGIRLIWAARSGRVRGGAA